MYTLCISVYCTCTDYPIMVCCLPPFPPSQITSQVFVFCRKTLAKFLKPLRYQGSGNGDCFNTSEARGGGRREGGGLTPWRPPLPRSPLLHDIGGSSSYYVIASIREKRVGRVVCFDTSEAQVERERKGNRRQTDKQTNKQEKIQKILTERRIHFCLNLLFIYPASVHHRLLGGITSQSKKSKSDSTKTLICFRNSSWTSALPAPLR